MYFWLTDTYGAATAPVAALFVIMTKVGVYCVARSTTLMFGADAGAATFVAEPWLPWLALATLALAAFGALAAWHLRRLVAYLVLASAGMLLLSVGLGSAGTIAAGLFYLVHSTVVAAALFLLVDSAVASRGEAGDEMVPAPLAGAGGYGALYFLLAVAVAGLPPFGGFLGKSMLLVASRSESSAVGVWAVVLLSSLGIVVALARAGLDGVLEGGSAECDADGRRARVVAASAARWRCWLRRLVASCCGLVRSPAMPRQRRSSCSTVLATSLRCSVPSRTAGVESARRHEEGEVMRLFPAPILSAMLFVSWLLLVGSVSAGHVVLAAALAIAIPMWSERLRRSARDSAPGASGGTARPDRALRHRRIGAHGGAPDTRSRGPHPAAASSGCRSRSAIPMALPASPASSR